MTWPSVHKIRALVRSPRLLLGVRTLCMAGNQPETERNTETLNAACGRSSVPHAQNDDGAGVRTLHSGRSSAAAFLFIALACFAAAIPLCLLLIQLRADALEGAVDRLFQSREAHAAP